MLIHDELLLALSVLLGDLLFQVGGDLSLSLSILLSFLLFGDGKLIVSELPELGELKLFLL